MIFVSCADVRFRGKAVDVVVGFVKFTVSLAYSVEPAIAALSAIEIVVSRKATVSDAEPAVLVEVFNSKLTQSMSNGPELPVVKAMPILLLKLVPPGQLTFEFGAFVG